MNIGERIKQLRKEIGISPEKLGDKSDVSGAYIRRLEAGMRHSITLDTAQKLVIGFRALGLQIDASDLLEKDNLPLQPEPTINELMDTLQKRLMEVPLVEIKVIGTIPGHYPFAIESKVASVNISKEELANVQNMDTIKGLIVKIDISTEGIFSGDVLVINTADTKTVDDKLYAFNIGNEAHIGRTHNSKMFYEEKPIPLSGIHIIGRVILSVRTRKY